MKPHHWQVLIVLVVAVIVIGGIWAASVALWPF